MVLAVQRLPPSTLDQVRTTGTPQHYCKARLTLRAAPAPAPAPVCPQALESNPRVAAGVHQAGDAIGSLVKSVSGLAHQAMGQPQEMAGPVPPAAVPANTAGGTFTISESDTSAGVPPTKPV